MCIEEIILTLINTISFGYLLQIKSSSKEIKLTITTKNEGFDRGYMNGLYSFVSKIIPNDYECILCDNYLTKEISLIIRNKE